MGAKKRKLVEPIPSIWERIEIWNYQRIMRRKADACYEIAISIVNKLDTPNGRAQEHLNAAKDSLYRAAYIFKQEASRP